MHMTNSNKPFVLDALQLYCQRPLNVSDKIVIYQPTVGQIVDYGELDFYSMLYVFIGNTTMFRLKLWEAGHDWNTISDYELFSIMVTGLPQKATEIIFGDVDFSLFQLDTMFNEEKQEEVIILNNIEQDIIIDEDIYKLIALCLRTMFGIFPKNEFARNKVTKEAIIWEDKENLRIRELNKKDKYDSTLLSMISSCVNHPGFKYKKKELEDVGIFEFMDAVQRLQVYESTTALLKGAYSGFMDTSKIDKEEFNFMRDIKKSS